VRECMCVYVCVGEVCVRVLTVNRRTTACYNTERERVCVCRYCVYVCVCV